MDTTMPIIDLDRVEHLTAEERELAEQILKPDSRLYASKPMKASGDGKFLWRMVAFAVSPIQKHQHLPMTADLDLDIDDYDERRERMKVLNEFAKRLEGTIPIGQRHGVMTWGRVFGIL